MTLRCSKVPKGGRRGGSKSQLTQMVRLKHPSDSPIITGKFDALLKDFGYLSDVYRALSESQFATEHRNRLLNAFAASTVFRYLQAIQQFSTTLGKLGPVRYLHHYVVGPATGGLLSSDVSFEVIIF